MSPTQNSDEIGTALRSEYRADETPVEAVVTAVAEVTDRSPLEMDPLGEVVDNDALNAFVDGHDDRPAPAAVTFDYCGQCVTVTTDDVRIAPSNESE